MGLKVLTKEEIDSLKPYLDTLTDCINGGCVENMLSALGGLEVAIKTSSSVIINLNSVTELDKIEVGECVKLDDCNIVVQKVHSLDNECDGCVFDHELSGYCSSVPLCDAQSCIYKRIK